MANLLRARIEVEDEKKVVSLDDLSPEDKERILQEAREIIDKENIEKNARAMYAMKKKELVDNTLKEITQNLRLTSKVDYSRLHDRFVSLTNYLYSLNHVNQKISTEKDWEIFNDICRKVHECILYCVKK